MRGLGLLALFWVLATAAAAAPPLEDYGKLPSVESMQLSPSGNLIAYAQVNGDERQVVVREVEGKVLRAFSAGKTKFRDLEWYGENHLVFDVSYTAEIKLETFNAVAVNVQAGTAKVIFGTDRNMLHAVYGEYGWTEQNGHTFGYFAGIELLSGGSAAIDLAAGKAQMSHGYADLFKVDLDTGLREKMAGGSDLHATRWIVSRTGRVVARSEYDPKTGAWRLYDAAGSLTPIARQTDPLGDAALIGQGRTAGSFVVQSTGEDGDWARFEYGPSGAAQTLFDGETPRVTLFSPDTGLLMGWVTNSDQPRTILFDTALQAKFDKVVRAFPGERAWLSSATASLDRMIIFTQGPGDSGTYFLVDYPTKKITAVGWLYPTIMQADVAPTRVVAYRAADGLEMQGVLTLPPGRGAKNLPVVVMPHDGPETRDYETFDYWAQAFTSRGYAVFQPNFRGSDGFGKAFRDAGHGQWGRKMQTDISDGVAELARQGVIDRKRACIVGASYGGYAALAGVTIQQGLYKCAVSVAGVGDLAALLRHVEETFGDRSAAIRNDRVFLGVNSNGDASLSGISPQKIAARADAPVLLIHGRDDTVVPFVQSDTMRRALASSGKTVELIELKAEDHWLSRAATRTQMLTASVAFVEKYNPPN